MAYHLASFLLPLHSPSWSPIRTTPLLAFLNSAPFSVSTPLTSPGTMTPQSDFCGSSASRLLPAFSPNSVPKTNGSHHTPSRERSAALHCCRGDLIPPCGYIGLTSYCYPFFASLVWACWTTVSAVNTRVLWSLTQAGGHQLYFGTHRASTGRWLLPDIGI